MCFRMEHSNHAEQTRCSKPGGNFSGRHCLLFQSDASIRDHHHLLHFWGTEPFSSNSVCYRSYLLLICYLHICFFFQNHQPSPFCVEVKHIREHNGSAVFSVEFSITNSIHGVPLPPMHHALKDHPSCSMHLDFPSRILSHHLHTTHLPFAYSFLC